MVDDFHPRPKWRYIAEGSGSGEEFRKQHLAPALTAHELVKVDLTGYNRYGPSFISEAFGGLIREEGMRLKSLEKKLEIRHDLLPSVVSMAWEEMREAEAEIHG